MPGNTKHLYNIYTMSAQHNFQSLEVVSRCRDPQLQVTEITLGRHVNVIQMFCVFWDLATRSAKPNVNKATFFALF